MSVPEPSKILTPWAASGLKNPIPENANPVTGNAGYDQGFPAINMTAKEAGGIPPFGQDFNGIFFNITQILQYMQAGGHPTYSSELSDAIGGYHLGAMLAKASGIGFWRNMAANNASDPDAGGSGWVSDSSGSYTNATAITASSTSLTATQVGQAFLFTTAGSTVALPAASGVPAGGVYKLHTSAGFTLSVTGGGAMQAGNTLVTSLSVSTGTEILAVCSGSSWWVFGTALAPLPKRTFASNDLIRIPDVPGGLILQWGAVTNSNNAGSGLSTVTFGTAFPNACRAVFMTPYTSAGSSYGVVYALVAEGYTGSGFTWVARTSAGAPAGVGTVAASYLAIGY